jgi:hypothetical protein
LTSQNSAQPEITIEHKPLLFFFSSFWLDNKAKTNKNKKKQKLEEEKENKNLPKLVEK